MNIVLYCSYPSYWYWSDTCVQNPASGDALTKLQDDVDETKIVLVNMMLQYCLLLQLPLYDITHGLRLQMMWYNVRRVCSYICDLTQFVIVMPIYDKLQIVIILCYIYLVWNCTKSIWKKSSIKAIVNLTFITECSVYNGIKSDRMPSFVSYNQDVRTKL